MRVETWEEGREREGERERGRERGREGGRERDRDKRKEMMVMNIAIPQVELLVVTLPISSFF